MMLSLFLLFNHALTAVQKDAAEKELRVSRIVAPPPAVLELWRDISPSEPVISRRLESVREWLRRESSPGDFVLIQGDFGACYLMVNFAFENGLAPIYSTTSRFAREEQQADGSIVLVHNFNHTIFRKYER